jgi:hypothetical protein
MILERSKNEILIRMSADIDLSELQSTLEYLRYKEATAGSKAKQTDADALAEEANRSMWAKIKADRGLR